MQLLGITVCCLTKTVKWDEEKIPFHSPEYFNAASYTVESLDSAADSL